METKLGIWPLITGRVPSITSADVVSSSAPYYVRKPVPVKGKFQMSLQQMVMAVQYANVNGTKITTQPKAWNKILDNQERVLKDLLASLKFLQ